MPDLLPIRLVKNADLSITGCLPDGKVVHWPSYVSNRPTRRNTKVMVNCYHWRPEWIEASQLTSTDPLLTRNPAAQRLSA